MTLPQNEPEGAEHLVHITDARASVRNAVGHRSTGKLGCGGPTALGEKSQKLSRNAEHSPGQTQSLRLALMLGLQSAAGQGYELPSNYPLKPWAYNSNLTLDVALTRPGAF